MKRFITRHFKSLLKWREPRVNSRSMPIYLFCYHKCGTVLLRKVFRGISAANNWQFANLAGMTPVSQCDADIAVFCHSLVQFDIDRQFIGIHFTRDPRDLVVSGYLHHLKTTEAWCTNRKADVTPPIRYPIVPHSQTHRPEEWKLSYVKSLEGRSYQDQLRALPREEGIRFEMEHYGRWTIEAMLSWSPRNNILEIRFEDLIERYDATWDRIFALCDFTESQLGHARKVARSHDLNRLSDQMVRKMKHVHGRSPSKWQKYFSAANREQFQEMFGDALITLGYEQSADWVDR